MWRGVYWMSCLLALGVLAGALRVSADEPEKSPAKTGEPAKTSVRTELRVIEADGLEAPRPLFVDHERPRSLVKTASATRRVRRSVVYQTDDDYAHALSKGPQIDLTQPALYGYVPKCHSDTAQFHSGLWDGYCAARKPHWSSRWFWGGWLFGRGGHCGCGHCGGCDDCPK